MRSLLHPVQLFIIGAVLLVMASSSLATSVSSSAAPEVVAETSDSLRITAGDISPAITASSYLVFDMESGETIVAHRDEVVLPIASVTKLLTAATVLRTFDLNATATIAKADYVTEGRAGRLAVGDTYTFYDLLFPLLLESSNDAAAVYERVTENDIIRQMNGLAAELGTKNLVAADASGLSDRNQASAQDLRILTRAIHTTLPHVFDITQLSNRVGPEIVWTNNSPVLTTNYRGGKHGYTTAANRTLVAIYNEKISNDERTIGYIILGSDDLRQDVRKLREHVLANVTLE